MKEVNGKSFQCIDEVSCEARWFAKWRSVTLASEVGSAQKESTRIIIHRQKQV